MLTSTRYNAPQVNCPPKRMTLMRAGIQELEQWLRDLVYLGLAELPNLGPGYWQQRRARLVDAKLPGIANRIEVMEQVLHLPDWQDLIALEIGRLFLLCQAFNRQESLAPEGQDELLLQLGLTQKKDKVLATPSLADTWVLIGQRQEIHTRWDLQRLWFYGQQSGQTAMLLEFSVQNRGFDTVLATGQPNYGEICFFPGSLPRRALFQKRDLLLETPDIPPAFDHLEGFLQHMADSFRQNPFLSQEIGSVRQLLPGQHNGICYLHDAHGQALPISPSYPFLWNLLSLSGGHPVDLAFEWDGYQAWPLSLYRDGRWQALN